VFQRVGKSAVHGAGAGKWAIVLAGLTFASIAQAQTVAPAPKATPQYNALFKRMFDDPSNVEVTFQFVKLATELGDYEAAIGALERILLFNPNLPRVKLQLGTLYFKLGAYAMARSYFAQAEASGDATIKAEAEQFVAELDRRLSPSHWSVFADTGLRYQTNATFGPDGSNIRSLGQNAILNSRYAKQADWNWFGEFGVNYSYDLKQSVADTIEASAVGYYAEQFKDHAFDFGLLETEVGPRFSLPVQGLSAKVYGIGDASSLSNAAYFTGGGTGASLRYLVNSAALAWLEPAVEYRHRTFYDSADFPISDQQTGGLLTVAVRGAGGVATNVQWFARLAFDQNTTDNPAFGFNSYNDWTADFGLPISFTLPWHNETRQIVITPTVGAGHADYAMADPSVDPGIVRRDQDWRVGGLVDVQVYRNYGVRLHIFYTETDSNLPNYDLRDLAISVGPTFRF
jgi:hypothetical protein